MNIFNYVTLQGMKKSRTRTLVTVIGIALSTALITAVLTFAISLQTYMVNGAMAKAGNWHVGFSEVDQAFAQEQADDPDVAHAAVFDNLGYATLEGGQNPNKPYLFLAGFHDETFATLPARLLSGRLPEHSSEVLIPSHVAANGGVHFAVGDTISLAVGSRWKDGKRLGQHDPYQTGTVGEPGSGGETLIPEAERTYTVVGIYERPAHEEVSAPGYTLITIAEPLAPADSYSVFVTLVNPRQVQAYVRNAAGPYSYTLNDTVLRFLGLTDDHTFNALLYTVGGILVTLVMVGSIFLIYNAFAISLNERTRQFGILSSVGATAKQLRNSVLFEGLCLGAIGIPLGVIAGVGSTALVIPLVAENFGNIAYDTVPLTLTISVPLIVVATLVSLVTILISAYLPARKAANTPVMESIRQTNEVKVDARDLQTANWTQRLWGLPGMLALKNFKRNKKRYRSIVLSLTLSVVLFVSGSTFSSHLKEAAQQFAMDADYDICLTIPDLDEEELFQLYEDLKTVDGVYDSSYQALMTYLGTVPAREFSDRYRELAGYDTADEVVELTLDIQFIPDQEYRQFLTDLGLPAAEYRGKGAKMVAVAKVPDKSQAGSGELIDLFREPFLSVTVKPETTSLPLIAQEQELELTFVDTFPLDTLPRLPSKVRPFVFMVVAPYQMRAQFETPGNTVEMGLTFQSENPAQSIVEMEQVIQGQGITSAYTLYNAQRIFEENRNIAFVVDVFTCCFVVMISLIAVANVFNTISTNIRLRRRELAMLRSVGMDEQDFSRMMNFECLFYGLKTLLLGLPAAGVIAWLIYQGWLIAGAEISFIFPWSSMAVSVLGVFLIVFVTMLYATSKIKKENIIEALRDDLT